jgi:hypothetical protein
MEAWFEKLWVWDVDWCRKLLKVAIQNYTEYKETTVASLMKGVGGRGSIVEHQA